MAESKRIVVVGDSCAGKTTFARALAQKLDAPHVELDAFNWLPNWQAATNEQFRAGVARAIAGDRWVVDGNYTNKLQDIVWAQADTIIWLDPALALILWRFFVRTFSRALTRKELWNGCRESLRTAIFSRNSLLSWILSSHARRRRQYLAAMAPGAYPHVRFVHLRSRSESQQYLAGLSP